MCYLLQTANIVPCIELTKPAPGWNLFLPLMVLELIALVVAYLLYRKEPGNSDTPRHPALIRVGGAIAGAVYILALDICFSFLPPLAKCEELRNGYLVSFGLLTVLPPLYFFIEATYFYGGEFGKCDNLKYSQELASRIWVAFTVLLGLYWFHNLKG